MSTTTADLAGKLKGSGLDKLLRVPRRRSDRVEKALDERLDAALVAAKEIAADRRQARADQLVKVRATIRDQLIKVDAVARQFADVGAELTQIEAERGIASL